MTSRATETRLVLIAFGLLAGLFIAFPQLDLLASGLFYRGAGHWALNREDLWLAIPYRGLPRLGQSLLVGLLLLWLLSFWSRLPRLKARRATLGFLLAGALLGPVLLVDATLKEHSGRTRPVNVEQFGGSRQFTPAFIPADQCAQNCSFVSGHVATASFIMAFGWLGAPAARRRWLLASLVGGGLFALVRMVPGGHFLSDTVFAWFATYFSLWAVEFLFRKFGWLPAGSD
ncbi:phosphatase PAP2 family protein [Dechloromonas denitrificans]|uniref:phosphatase PAP2 family protein n=1 Tax=Dechloromonas denitrificans TaxID=281362 RepID=UPI001CF7ED75|nr:phosphatase PAP2 family protein [Dechloromonas denitrificans]UCV04363.1 phosphatase PAP2 family protein [Dechloromonas denitrificans]